MLHGHCRFPFRSLNRFLKMRMSSSRYFYDTDDLSCLNLSGWEFVGSSDFYFGPFIVGWKDQHIKHTATNVKRFYPSGKNLVYWRKFIRALTNVLSRKTSIVSTLENRKFATAYLYLYSTSRIHRCIHQCHQLFVFKTINQPC